MPRDIDTSTSERSPEVLVEGSLEPAPARRRGLRRSLIPIERKIEDAFRQASARATDGEGISTADEWLLDNHYVVRRAIREFRAGWSASFERRLPGLADGPWAGLPRAHAVAQALLEQCGAVIDPENLASTLAGSADVSTMHSAEIWALPMLLRLGLLERLDQALGAHASAQDSRPGMPAHEAEAALADRRARRRDRSVGTAIQSLATLDKVDWRQFFESVSPTEPVLRSDPAGIYGRMDFDTRDRYRKVVEDLAQYSPLDEVAVAHAAVEAALRERTDVRAGHVGAWLVADRRPALERAIGYRPPLGVRFRRMLVAHPTCTYLGSIGVLAAALGLAALGGLWRESGPVLAISALPLALLLALTVAVSFVNTLISWILPPRVLPKMDYEEGIPEGRRVVVVVPCLLNYEAEIDSLVEHLETRYLGNADVQMAFALLADLGDAQEARTPADEALVRAASVAIGELNDKYEMDGRSPFLLLARKRLWNPGERCWMGWERKRGKLTEFNRLLAGGVDTSFETVVGDLTLLEDVDYVITLDADTELPRGAARRLVGTLDHPLNRARVDPVTGRVLEGYTVLQPRVEVTPSASVQSFFSRLFSADRGIDLYTRAVSDAYQDLFGEGIYVGKGIYDVHAFEESLKDRVPENAILSHDLFEGVHGRAALVSDVVLYEDYPTRYLTYARRLHRWIRGDWQLLPWLRSSVPSNATETDRVENPLTLISRWKILHNLCRSLLSPSILGLLVLTWLVLPGAAWVWTLGVLLVPAVPAFSGMADGLLRGTRTHGIRLALLDASAALPQALGRWALAVAFTPFEAILALDALVRTLVRLFATRRLLLQWTPVARAAEMVARNTTARAWLTMSAGPLLATALGVAIKVVHPAVLPIALPLLAAWFLSPAVALWISRPHRWRAPTLGPGDERRLRGLARQTWLYFETHVGPDSHWLPPDHLQEHPRGEVARRTSPTNIGLGLLATVTAFDLGYVGPRGLATLLRNTMDTLSSLERHAGHPLNWYDTASLKPLAPRYVSTVDNGNLAAALIALQQACIEILGSPPDPSRMWRGARDTADLLAQALSASPPIGAPARMQEARDLVQRIGREIDRACARPGSADREARTGVEHCLRDFEKLCTEIPGGASTHLAGFQECSLWALRLRQQLQAMEQEFPAAPSDPAETELDPMCVRSPRADLQYVIGAAQRLLDQMDFRRLYDEHLHLFRLGIDVAQDTWDSNSYDLLASEARLASFVAIAKGDAPVKHWLHLGRPIGRVTGRPTLLSWGGSMFEYLLPPMLAREEGDSLLHEAAVVAVRRQMAYGNERHIPWGVSESGYYAFDGDQNYQYRSFGVPGLGFRRGLEDDMVVAPYASLMALPYAPREVLRNLDRLEAHGACGHFGMYEALDFTPSRRPAGRACGVVRSYMAHHQGMILLALSRVLLNGRMVQRFHRDAGIRTVEALLHERIPTRPAIERTQVERRPTAPLGARRLAGQSWEPSADAFQPQAHVLSNGRLTSVVTARCAGGLAWGRHSLTRCAQDPTLEESGLWIHVRDEAGGGPWIVGRPEGEDAQLSRVTFWPHKMQFQQREDDLTTSLQVFIAPEDDVEIRHLWIANRTDRTRRLTVCSQADVALAPSADDRRHPAFSKLFIESRYVPDLGGILFRRRETASDDGAPVLFHVLVAGPRVRAELHHESSREVFLGRGRRRQAPLALDAQPPALTGSTGFTLDPIMALAATFELGPRRVAEFMWLTVVAPTEADALRQASRLSSFAAVEQALEDARQHSDALINRRQIEPARLAIYGHLLSLLLNPHGMRRGREAMRRRPTRGASGLWPHGLSGDLPILLVRIGGSHDGEVLLDVLRAHGWWRARGVLIDLVILDEQGASYGSPLKEQVQRAIRQSGAEGLIKSRGGVFLIESSGLAPSERYLLLAAARVVLSAKEGPIEAQLALRRHGTAPLPALIATRAVSEAGEEASLPRPDDLRFDNGLGGFTADGRAYVIHLESGQTTPAPWCNVIANPQFGSLVSESGGGCTWAENSTLNRLTPFRNDPVADPPTESLYLRDEETAEIWSPTPLPARAVGTYQVRHEPGRTVFRHRSHELDQELELFVAAEDPIKVFHLTLRNTAARPRRVTATLFVEWVLGEDAIRDGPFVAPYYDAERQVLFATNPWNEAFADRTAFLASLSRLHGLTADRTEFLGRAGRRDRPAALQRIGLSGTVEAGRDPCGAIQVHVDLEPHATEHVSFLLGEAPSREAMFALVERYRRPNAIARASQEVEQLWDGLLGTLVVRTPDEAMNLLLNRWLLHQLVSSRLWGRVGPYQPSGAFGFRDQLQDVLALVHARPEIVRRHLLAASARQFVEGDVLHWWHPGVEAGIRSRCSDDMLWLPFAVAHYVLSTGDRSVLSETVPFLDAEPLAPDEVDRYARYAPSEEKATLYEHCLRALRRAASFGTRGLPRMGSGDWNDGMNRVGVEGRGESVWLGWFLCSCLTRFAEVCTLVGNEDEAKRLREQAEALGVRTDAAGWDGDWYLRAFDDAGDALGTATATECRIDLLPQSWAILSGAAPDDRAARALESAWSHLVRPEEGIVLLLEPPFDRTPKDPGYIKAYPPGVRENGGQYTHAAAWLAWAHSLAGHPDRAHALFRMVSPMRHASTPQDAQRYRTEPYVVAGDVYGVAPHAGRGGWTWYTGAAAWLYRFAVEGLLGIRLGPGAFDFDPHLPSDWEGYDAIIREGGTTWRVAVENGAAEGATEVELDGVLQPGPSVPRTDDGKEHDVRIRVSVKRQMDESQAIDKQA